MDYLEGFFLTLIRKKDGSDTYPISKKIKSRLEKMPKQFAEVRNWLSTSDSEFFAKNEFLIAFPENHIPVLNALSEQLRIISYGLPVAQFKKNDLIPEHTFALSVDRNPDIFESIELDFPNQFSNQRMAFGNFSKCATRICKKPWESRQQLLSERMANKDGFAWITEALVFVSSKFQVSLV